MTPRYKIALAASLALLVVCAEWFIFAIYVGPRQEAARELAQLTETLRKESQRAQPNDGDHRGASVPDLLERVQELAAEGGVAVDAIQPAPGGDGEQFNLAFQANYGNLLQFLAKFETLQVSITGFEIAPAMLHPELLAVSVNFRHTAVPGVTAARAKNFAGELRSRPLRNPFDSSAGPVAWGLDSGSDDLTWALHLTSISEVGNSRFATIDGQDYGIGDTLQGRVVSQIGDDSVTLTAKDGAAEREFVLRFRSPLPRGT